jgi:hypothetical protein
MTVKYQVAPFTWTVIPTVSGELSGLAVFYQGPVEQVIELYDDDSIRTPLDDIGGRWKVRKVLEGESFVVGRVLFGEKPAP